MPQVIDFSLKRQKLNYHFAVYELPITNNADTLATERFIVIKNQYGDVIRFTGLEKYSNPFTGRKQRRRTRSKQELYYTCGALNGILFGGNPANNARSIARVTKEMIFNYFDHYRTTPMENGDFVGQQSLDKCVRVVTCFFANAALASGAISAIEPTELFLETYEKANKDSKKVVMKYIPIYQEKTIQVAAEPIFRDIPIDAMGMLLDVCKMHSPDIYFAVVAQCTSGIRPGETMNMRREDSPSGRGISVTMYGSTIRKIEIDLRQEVQLRSDGVIVGRIKCERKQLVYPVFIPIFYEAYQHHLHYLHGRKYEADFAPMFINRSGKAMTYKSYVQKFQSFVHDYLRPRLLESDQPELQVFAQRLLTEKLSPHSLRHFFTVMLVLLDEDVAQIQSYRGDSSPESALLYLKNKGALIKEASTAHTELIESLMDIGKNKICCEAICNGRR